MKRAEIDALCKALESELNDWKYLKTKTHFINKNGRFFEKIIRYAWYLQPGGIVTSQPSIMINVPEITKAYKKYVGVNHSPYFMAHLDDFTPLTVSTYYIYPNRDHDSDDGVYLSEQSAPRFVRDVFNYGEELLNRLYDFSSYENFIKNIPADLNWSRDERPWPELTQKEKEYERIQQIFQERDDFIYYGLLRMKLGDFDYIRNYNEYGNIVVGDIKERCDLIIKNIPEIKDTWERTGKLI